MNKLRSLALMSPILLEKYQLFASKMKEAKLPFDITCVARTVKEQVALYSQGRDSLITVNKLRRVAGLDPIKQSQNIVVTWTLMSKHLVDFDDGIEANNWSRAFDIVILNGKKYDWNIKCNVNKNEESDYLEAAKIGKSVGLICGAFFKNAKGQSRPDFPHYEI